MYKTITSIKKGEYWYGGFVSMGHQLPFGKSIQYINLKKSMSSCHSNHLMVSSKGRYIWSDKGFKLSSFCGIVTIESETPIRLECGFLNLREAYLDAMMRFFPAKNIAPQNSQIEKPQYSTWMALGNEIDENILIAFAESILKSGFPSGELIIDDGWQANFGDWHFDERRFRNPKKMIEELHKLGFKVVLWVTPFVAKEAASYVYLSDKNALIRNKDGLVATRNWWNGGSALLDMSSPVAKQWLKKELDILMTEYGVDGFKFDGGDAMYYTENDLTYIPTAVSDVQSELWARFGVGYAINELRASTANGGEGFTARLSDRSHLWGGGSGLRSVVPGCLTCGIIGLPFVCPDMVGGGWIVSAQKDLEKYDKELLIRWMQASALMPMVQLSIELWKIEDKAFISAIKEALALRKQYIPYILSLCQDAKRTGEPIVRYMEYNYPNEGLAKVNDQFMLGDEYLVAPVMHKGRRSRVIFLPKNTRWQNLLNGQEYKGGKPIEVKAELNQLPVLKKLN